MNFSQKNLKIVEEQEKKLVEQFAKIDENALYNQQKVLSAFQKNAVQARHFFGTTGYGYDDIGRDTLGKVFADIFHTESAIVSPLIANGTHALTLALFGILRPDDLCLSITGALYDTLHDVIYGKNIGSLADFKIKFDKIDLIGDKFDLNAISSYVSNIKTKLVFIQRSRGYSSRNALSVNQIAEAIKTVKNIDKNIIVAVDNCYGEFVEKIEPTDVGADLVIGSLIKNIGGGIAPTGAYLAGKNEVIEQIAGRLTAPSLKTEVGSYIYGYLPYYQGVFLAPTSTANALKGSQIFGAVYSFLGFETIPKPYTACNDIIRSIKFDTEQQLIAFCQSIQKASPVDSNVVPMPWDMPGYADQVIMAAGAFIQGSSIELSADSPIKKPYIAYLQGGLTYEHVKTALLYTLENLEIK